MTMMNDKKSEGGNEKAKESKQVGDFIIGKTLGEGTFGKVRLGIHKHTNQKVAIKFLQKKKISQVSDAQRVTREIHILKHIRHPNLVQLYQIIQTPKQLLLIMQYMQNGQLFEHIVRNKRIPEQEAKRMFHQIIDGIEYVHKIGVAHRDLKPENILLSYNHSLKIVDFGLSNTYKKNEMLKTPCGSPCYAAPEMIQGQRYSGLKVDIWSCGIILFAMLNGYLPFQDEDTNSLYKKILSGTYQFHHSVSSVGRDLIQKILNNNPHQRFTIQQIRKHQWMSLDYQRRRNDGIVVGYNKIPVDPDILAKMQQYGSKPSYDKDYVQTCVEINRHNDATVTYYLTMKKHLKQGGRSKFDLGNSQFDRTFIEPVKRKQTINTTDILIQNFFTKTALNNNKSADITQGRKVSGNHRLSREKEENKENVSVLGNHNGGSNGRKRSKDNCNHVMLKPQKSKDKSKDHMKLALKQHSVMNTSNMILSNGGRVHNKLNQSIQKQRQSSHQKRPPPPTTQKLTSSSTTSKIASKANKNLQTITTKLDNSINYGRIPMTRSIQKTSGRESSSVYTTANYRQSIIQNRVTRKYKQQFNQSLISKSRGKLKSQRIKERSRVNSTSINNQSVSQQQQHSTQSYVGFNTASSQMYTNGSGSSGHVLMNLSKKYKDHDNSTCYVEEYLMRGKKLGQKKHCSTSIKQPQTQSNKLIKPRRL